MNALWWVIALVIAAGAGVAVMGFEPPVVQAVWLGIAGPVLMAGTSWTVTTRTWARDRAALLPLMLRAFAAKVVFAVAYVVVMLKGAGARPTPFLAAFIAAYMATHLAEAVCLRRLMVSVVGNDGTQVE
jgi:hypothetical protein